jgi:hypothetical protein
VERLDTLGCSLDPTGSSEHRRHSHEAAAENLENHLSNSRFEDARICSCLPNGQICCCRGMRGFRTAESAVSLLKEPANSHDGHGIRAPTEEKEGVAQPVRNEVGFFGGH